MGAWVTYGLGSESQNLPGFVVIGSGMIPPGGLDNFNSGFLPASYQGSLFQKGEMPVADLKPSDPTAKLQMTKLNLMRKLDQRVLDRIGKEDQLESAIANYELAFRMQTAVPELMDIKSETKATLDLYGVNDKPTELYGRQYQNLKRVHEDNARAVDKPIGGLLSDLKARGMLDSTLIVFAGEFGRTPMAQGSDGRDHNPFGFSIWLAGGGVKGGTIHGATDDYGYHAIQGKVEIHDLHATMLHLLRLDHRKSTYRYGGRDMRLTDVHGEIVTSIVK